MNSIKKKHDAVERIGGGPEERTDQNLTEKENIYEDSKHEEYNFNNKEHPKLGYFL